MSSGSRLVIAIFAGVAMIAAVAVGGFLLSGGRGDRLECVRGEETVNPKSPEGLTLPLTRGFATIAEAEAFICHRVAYPRDLNGWRLQGVNAMRSHNLGEIIEGKGFASVSIAYTDDRPGTSLRFEVSPFSLVLPESSQQRQIRVRGQPAVLQRGGPGAEFADVTWHRDGLDILATAILGDGFSERDFLTVLESVR
jgi:hypothetical protein